MRDGIEMDERRSRGRPRSFDKDKVLQVILEEFWSKGFATTSLDDLTNATGLSRPSLYAAYGDKTAIYGAALEAFGARMREHAVPALHNADDLRTALSGFFNGALDVYFSGKTQALGCLVFSTAIADAPRDPLVRAFLQRFLSSLDQELDACLERFLPEMPVIERRRLAQIAGGILTNLATRARSGMPRAELNELAEASVILIASATLTPSTLNA